MVRRVVGGSGDAIDGIMGGERVLGTKGDEGN
jgi:hypothetical protein